MSDIADAVQQDEVAESLVAPIAEPAQETGTEEAAQEQPQEAAEVPTEEEGNEAETTDWLPTEQQKVFPQEIVAKYGTRYGYSAEDIAADPRLQRALSERMNQDIYIDQLRKEQELQQLEDPEETTQGPTPPPALTREQHFQQLDNIVRQKTDPDVAKQFHSDFLRSFNVPEDEIAKVNPQQSVAFTQMVSKYVLNLMSTFAPEVIDPRLRSGLEASYPDMGKMYEVASNARAWDVVRNSSEEFSGLPPFGTKEFVAQMKQAATELAGSPERFEAMQFKGAKTVAENNRMKYEMLAKQITGRGANPALVKQALETGAKKAKQQQQKQAAGTLGKPVIPNKSNAKQTQPTAFQTNSDIFDEDAMDLYRRNHGSL